MSETRNTDSVGCSATVTDETVDIETEVSVRVSAHSYSIALLLGTYFSALFFYLGYDPLALVVFAISWIVIPTLALNDRILFDGTRISRSGLIPRLWSWLNTSRRRLRIADIEQVETQTIQKINRGGDLVYRYRTDVRGKGLSISIASGSQASGVGRNMVAAILKLLPDNVLDNRSIELRDHLADPKEALMRAEFSRIPSAEVLESSFKVALIKQKRASHPTKPIDATEDDVDDLRSLANELWILGYLVRASEAFRRALVLRPNDASLLFEFARCLHSLGRVRCNSELERRSLAALRMVEQRAANDGELFVRLGEWYFQIGEWRRAGSVFRKANDLVGENFRTARGLAEIALSEGKIAHVIHHFSTANRLAETPSLRRWSSKEARYFSSLHDDDEYMELEIGRVKMLETVEGSKKTALRIALFAVPLIVVGILFGDDLVANLGWAVSTVGLLIWAGLIASTNLLRQRIPHELMVGDD